MKQHFYTIFILIYVFTNGCSGEATVDQHSERDSWWTYATEFQQEKDPETRYFLLNRLLPHSETYSDSISSFRALYNYNIDMGHLDSALHYNQLWNRIDTSNDFRFWYIYNQAHISFLSGYYDESLVLLDSSIRINTFYGAEFLSNEELRENRSSLLDSLNQSN